MTTNLKTTIFGLLAAITLWLHQSGTIKPGSTLDSVDHFITAVAVAATGVSAKDASNKS